MNIIKKYTKVNLILRIFLGLVIGACLGILVNYLENGTGGAFSTDPQYSFLASIAVILKVLGNIFIGALRGVAPVLVFFLITSSLMSAKTGGTKSLKKIIILYIVGTFFAALIAVLFNFVFAVQLTLPSDVDTSAYSAPSGMGDIIINLFNRIIENPIKCVSEANFLGVLFWSIIFGICARGFANDNFKEGFSKLSDVLTAIVRVIIECAPFGICGLVFSAIEGNGIGIFTDYGYLLLVYLGCSFCVLFIFNPMLVFACLRRNPYPLVFRALKDVGLTAFFTRSSAANIPMNMKFCKELHLDWRTFSLSIPLGSTINMEGASITIVTLTLACCKTLGIEVDFAPALLLSTIAAISAVGASGVSGGSILLVPMACSLFGISGDIASGVVAIGFIIGVVQDSVETALNSSTDGLFTAAVLLRERINKGEEVHKIIGGTLEDWSVMEGKLEKEAKEDRSTWRRKSNEKVTKTKQ